MNRFDSIVATIAVSALLSMSLSSPARAAIVGTEALMSQGAEARHRAEVDAFLARAEVREQLSAWGVAPADVEQRLASLSAQELERLALSIERQPAGGDALAVIGIVFVVLLILELVGVTNVFTSI